MALDAAYLRSVALEIGRRAVEARVEKIYQPERDELVLVFKNRSETLRLVISANANYPRVHITAHHKENPMNAPMLCMLMRKHILGGKFLEVTQPGLERVLRFSFQCRNELGDIVLKHLIVEIMGRHSNIILCGDDDIIIEAVKHVDFTMSDKRQLLPGLRYRLPPAQDKIDPLELLQGGMRALLSSAPADTKIDVWLQKKLLGVSAIACREVCFAACKQVDASFHDLTLEQSQKLGFFMEELGRRIREGDFAPCMVCESTDSKPLDFCFMPISQYGFGALTKSYDSPSELLDDFYTRKDSIERGRKKSADMLKTIVNANNRVLRKLSAQREELKNAKDREKIKITADLLMANLYRLEKGQRSVELENFYDVDCPTLLIGLDEKLTPNQNAQKYYKEYQKAKTAEQYLKAQIMAGEQELEYLESLFDSLARAESEKELGEIREELMLGGYIAKKEQHKKPSKKAKTISPMVFLSSDGFEILCGKNNQQNDFVTLKIASKQDIWFHVKNAAGSHTVVITGGETPPERTLTEAAVIAAYHSRVRESHNTPVDYALIKNVKKPSGAKPGMVIYENNKTAYVTPNGQLVEALRKE